MRLERGYRKGIVGGRIWGFLPTLKWETTSLKDGQEVYVILDSTNYLDLIAGCLENTPSSSYVKAVCLL